MKTEINKDAPVWAFAEIIIHAPIERVWGVLTGFDKWPEWNADVTQIDLQGPVAVGTKFTWKAGGVGLASEIQHVVPQSQIVWSGRAMGMNAIHFWSFQPQGDGIRVHTEESFEGLLPRLLPGFMRRKLSDELTKVLLKLKGACEAKQ